MASIKLSRKKIITLAVISVFAVMMGYFWRDLHLGERTGNVKIPDVVVENIEVERLIGGKKWKFISPRIEHKDGIVYAKSIDIFIMEKNGKKTRLTAVNGKFSRENNNITMTDAKAVMADKKKDYSFSAGEVKYEASKETWHFSNGVVFIDENLKIEGQSGRYNTKNGDCRILNGGKVTWTK